MTKLEMANFICGKVNQTDPEDIEACKGFLSRRHEMLWQDQLWKDSLVEYRQTLDPVAANYTPASNYLPTKGVLLLPPGIERVLAVRDASRSIQVQRPEYFYRIDWDAFAQRGAAHDFMLLPACVWEWDSEVYPLALRTSAADSEVSISVDLIDADGVGVSRSSHTLAVEKRLLGFSSQLDVFSKSATDGAVRLAAINPDDAIVISGAGTAGVNGTYTRAEEDVNGRPAYEKGDYRISWLLGNIFDPGDKWAVYDNPPAPLSASRYYFSTDDVDVPQIVTTWQTGGVAVGDLPGPTFPEPASVLTVSAETINAARRQRIRLVEIPDVALTIRVLGKRPAPDFSGDNDEPGLSGIANCLIAFSMGDMLQRERQYGKANALFSEAMQLLDQLKRVEVVQQAHNQRIIPDSGFGGEDYRAFTGIF
jgi:hypothetical protein